MTDAGKEEGGSLARGAPDDCLYVFSDGGARLNPGPAGAGGLARIGDDRVVAEVCEYLGTATNNVAEYYALILILEAVAEAGFRRVKVHTDSTLVANQVKGSWRIKDDKLKPLVGRVRTLLEPYREVEVKYIPREKNSECDALATQAIDEGLLGLKEPLLGPTDETLFGEPGATSAIKRDVNGLLHHRDRLRGPGDGGLPRRHGSLGHLRGP